MTAIRTTTTQCRLPTRTAAREIAPLTSVTALTKPVTE